MSGHTPGPWTIADRADSERRRHIVRDVVGDSSSIAIVCARASSPASGPQYYEAEANAHLIAAAPSLLAALRMCRAVIGCGSRNARLRVEPEAIAQADAVLALVEEVRT